MRFRAAAARNGSTSKVESRLRKDADWEIAIFRTAQRPAWTRFRASKTGKGHLHFLAFPFPNRGISRPCGGDCGPPPGGGTRFSRRITPPMSPKGSWTAPTAGVTNGATARMNVVVRRVRGLSPSMPFLVRLRMAIFSELLTVARIQSEEKDLFDLCSSWSIFCGGPALYRHPARRDGPLVWVSGWRRAARRAGRIGRNSGRTRAATKAGARNPSPFLPAVRQSLVAPASTPTSEPPRATTIHGFALGRGTKDQLHLGLVA